jgi:hypothetical protein
MTFRRRKLGNCPLLFGQPQKNWKYPMMNWKNKILHFIVADIFGKPL